MAHQGLVTQLTACVPMLRCVGPIKKSAFLSLQNIMHPLLCAALGPPGSVSRTVAVTGADGLGACERTACSRGSPAALLPSAHLGQPQPPVAHTSNHVSPSVQVLWAHRKRHVSSQLVTASVCALSSLPRFPTKTTSLCLASALPTPTPHSPYCHWGAWPVTQRRGRGPHGGPVPNSQEMATAPPVALT